ncbi:DUF1348 family protein [Mycolicibacterium goodii]|nr:DUF1348 family protein [Mycolicibacterium goodii]
MTKLWLVEAAWNAFDPHLIAVACTPNSLWRSKDVYLVSRAQIVEILTLTRYREPIPHSVWHCGHSATTGSAGVHCEYEGDPFGGPVAMRLGGGGSWSTVGRTRLG